jgi:hypothetical protein
VNALILAEKAPTFRPFLGVQWVTDEVFVVNKFVFACLLGVRTVDGSFFHQQGNFPSHGFVELSFQEASEIAEERGLGPVDSTNMRFLKHGSGGLTRKSTEFDLAQLKWIPS